MTGEIPPSRPSAARSRDRAPDGRPSVDLGRLASDLRSLGLRRGQDLLVHSAMSAIGWVDGGPATVLRAIQEVAGPDATIVVSAQTPWTSRTSQAYREVTAGLDQELIDIDAASLSAFDPASTPSWRTGLFAEHVRTRPGARRSAHPQASFAALGPEADAVTFVHDPECHLGERSPLRWLYDADAAVLLLGVGYVACSAFHLAEYRVRGHGKVRGADLDDSDFGQLGAALEDHWRDRSGPDKPLAGDVGMASCRVVPVRTAVNFAVGWMEKHRLGWAHDK